jgi:hypothetical protein
MGVSVLSMGGLGEAEASGGSVGRLGAVRVTNGAGAGDGSMSVGRGLPVVPMVTLESSTVIVTP